MRSLVFALLLLAAIVVVAPSASAEHDVVTCVKNKLDCETVENVIWAVRCIGDSLSGHHCTAP